MLGIGGVLTYKNSGLPAVLEHIPLDYILLETDAPFLSPVPYRGKRNESSFIPEIASWLCEIYKVSIEEIAGITTANARRLFRF
jgi:TatD DNase family protein